MPELRREGALGPPSRQRRSHRPDCSLPPGPLHPLLLGAERAHVARPAPVRDPRFRPFRVAAYALYLTVVSTFCLLVISSVVRSVRAMSPRADPVQAPTLDRVACAARAEALFRELDRHRRELSTGGP